MDIFLPYRGEFGFICMFHAPQVHAHPHEKTVVTEKGMGMEALYPDCQYLYCPMREDKDRRARTEAGWYAQIMPLLRAKANERFGHGDYNFIPPSQKAPRKYFVPVPYKLAQEPSAVDFVLCPRKRDYGADKNWSHWNELAERLAAEGFSTGAVGHPDTSFHLKHVDFSAWDGAYDNRYLDATISAMRQCSAVIATDNGLAHLALMCGKPLILISHADGLVAEGKDDAGKPYWPIKIERFNQENHKHVPIHIAKDSWHSIENVVAIAKEIICQIKTLH